MATVAPTWDHCERSSQEKAADGIFGEEVLRGIGLYAVGTINH